MYTILLLFSLLSSHLNPLNICWIYLAWKPAKLMCQKDPPKWPAEMTRQNNLPWQLAEFKCDFNPRNLLARNRRHCNSRYWLARESPLPRSKSPSKTRPPTPPPPPHRLRVTEGGRGGGELTQLAQTSRTGTLPFLYISFYIFHMIQHIRILHRAD